MTQCLELSVGEDQKIDGRSFFNPVEIAAEEEMSSRSLLSKVTLVTVDSPREYAKQRFHVWQSVDNNCIVVDRTSSVYRQVQLRLSTCAQPESWFGSFYRQAYGAVDSWGVLTVSKLNSNFVSEPISEFVYFLFFVGSQSLYWGGIIPIDCNLNSWIVLRVLGLICLREFYSWVCSFSNLNIWITL